MQFSIVIPEIAGSPACRLSLDIHGREPNTNAVYLTMEGEERLAATLGGQLILSKPIKLQYANKAGVTYVRIINHLDLEDLPQSLRIMLRALRCAGNEVDLEFCESCGGLVTAHAITLRQLSLCPSCERGRKVKPTQDDIQC